MHAQDTDNAVSVEKTPEGIVKTKQNTKNVLFQFSLKNIQWTHVHVSDATSYKVFEQDSLFDKMALRQACSIHFPEADCILFFIITIILLNYYDYYYSFNVAKGVCQQSTIDFTFIRSSTGFEKKKFNQNLMIFYFLYNKKIFCYILQCLALTFSFRLNDDGSLAEYKIKPTELKNVKRLSYETVDKALSKGDDDIVGLSSKEREMILTLASIAEQRKQWRERQGYFRFNAPQMSM